MVAIFATGPRWWIICCGRDPERHNEALAMSVLFSLFHFSSHTEIHILSFVSILAH